MLYGGAVASPSGNRASQIAAEHQGVKKSVPTARRDQSGPQAAPLASANPSAPSPLNEMDQLVSAARLLEILWDQATRPSVRWLRTQQKRRAIPYIQIGRRIWKTLAGEWNPTGAGDDFPARQI